MGLATVWWKQVENQEKYTGSAPCCVPVVSASPGTLGLLSCMIIVPHHPCWGLAGRMTLTHAA